MAPPLVTTVTTALLLLLLATCGATPRMPPGADDGDVGNRLDDGCDWTGRVHPRYLTEASLSKREEKETEQLHKWHDNKRNCSVKRVIAKSTEGFFSIVQNEDAVILPGYRLRTSTSLWGEWMGVMHGDEIEYVFGHPLNMSVQYRDKERDLSLRMMQAFAHFALTGKPTVGLENWPQYTRDDPVYYIFNAEHDGTGRGPRAKECAFWNELLPHLANDGACGGAGAADSEGNALSASDHISPRPLTFAAPLLLLLPCLLRRITHHTQLQPSPAAV